MTHKKSNLQQGASQGQRARLHPVAALVLLALPSLVQAQQGVAEDVAALPAVQVKASQYDADDVRPEGVTRRPRPTWRPKT